MGNLVPPLTPAFINNLAYNLFWDRQLSFG